MGIDAYISKADIERNLNNQKLQHHTMIASSEDYGNRMEKSLKPPENFSHYKLTVLKFSH